MPSFGHLTEAATEVFDIFLFFLFHPLFISQAREEKKEAGHSESPNVGLLLSCSDPLVHGDLETCKIFTQNETSWLGCQGGTVLEKLAPFTCILMRARMRKQSTSLQAVSNPLPMDFALSLESAVAKALILAHWRARVGLRREDDHSCFGQFVELKLQMT